METRSVKRLGELLLRESLISVEQLDKALEDQSTTGSSLGSSLVKLGYISESDLMDFLSRQFGVPAVDPTKLDIDQKIIEKKILNLLTSNHLAIYCPLGKNK